ncbi:MAG: site-2 protease family protein [Gemmatimonas sp.]
MAFDLNGFLVAAPVLLFSMVAHEYAHGYAALKQGDTTAQDLGRLTFNPAKHIDPFMTVILPVSLAVAGMPIFGGAKPVPVNPANYVHYRRGDIIVSMAGIVTNLGIAALSIPLVIIIGMIGKTFAEGSALADSAGILQAMAIHSVQINMVLALFNLIPLPPLDGSHVFKYLLPIRLAIAYQRIGSIGFLLLFALLYFGSGILQWWFTPMYVAFDHIGALILPYKLPNPFLK